MKNILIIFVGIIFGFVLVESQIISWYRIQEMAFFDSFHMYGVIMTAIITGAITLQIIKKINLKSLDGEIPAVNKKIFQKHNIAGGLIFGLGWSIAGACPGPIFALIGSGALPYIIVGISAFVGGLVFSISPFNKGW